MCFSCIAAASQQKKECPTCRAVFTRIKHRGEFHTVTDVEELKRKAVEAQQREANRIVAKEARGLREQQNREFEEGLAADRAAEAAARARQQAASTSLPQRDRDASSSSEEDIEKETVEARQVRLRAEFATEQAARGATNRRASEAAPQSVAGAGTETAGQPGRAEAVFDPEGASYAELTELFHWPTAERLRDHIIPVKQQELERELTKSHEELTEKYAFTAAQILDKKQGKAYL